MTWKLFFFEIVRWRWFSFAGFQLKFLIGRCVLSPHLYFDRFLGKKTLDEESALIVLAL